MGKRRAVFGGPQIHAVKEGADRLVAKGTDPINDRFNHIDRIIPHSDVLKPELIEMFEAPTPAGWPG